MPLQQLGRHDVDLVQDLFVYPSGAMRRRRSAAGSRAREGRLSEEPLPHAWLRARAHPPLSPLGRRAPARSCPGAPALTVSQAAEHPELHSQDERVGGPVVYGVVAEDVLNDVREDLLHRAELAGLRARGRASTAQCAYVQANAPPLRLSSQLLRDGCPPLLTAAPVTDEPRLRVRVVRLVLPLAMDVERFPAALHRQLRQALTRCSRPLYKVAECVREHEPHTVAGVRQGSGRGPAKGGSVHVATLAPPAAVEGAHKAVGSADAPARSGCRHGGKGPASFAPGGRAVGARLTTVGPQRTPHASQKVGATRSLRVAGLGGSCCVGPWR